MFQVTKLLLNNTRIRITSFSNSKATLCHLSQRCVVRVQGTESSEFLQGLMTNDMTHLDESEDSPGNKSIFAMFLNTQGRVMFDSFIIKADPETYLIDCDKDLSNKLVKHLKMYKVRRKLNIAKDENLQVFADLTQDSESPSASEGCFSYNDTRVKELGLRIIQSAGNSKETSQEIEHKKLRYKLGVCEGGQEIPFGKVTPLEYNLVYNHGVSFHKGCYLGQELTARTHHTGVIRKRIMPLEFSQNLTENSEYLGSKILNENGKNVGLVRGIASELGLGLCRIEECLKAEKLQLEANPEVQIKVKVPDWWPPTAPKTPQNRKE